MATIVNWDTLRELAGVRAERGCAISLYLGLDPTGPDVAVRVNALLAHGERKLDARRDELTHEARQGVQADLERIRRWFAEEFDRSGTAGVAVFASRRTASSGRSRSRRRSTTRSGSTAT